MTRCRGTPQSRDIRDFRDGSDGLVIPLVSSNDTPMPIRPKTGLKQGVFRRPMSVFEEYYRFCQYMEVGRLRFWSNEADFGGL